MPHLGLFFFSYHFQQLPYQFRVDLLNVLSFRSSRCFTIAWGREVNFFSQTPCNLSEPDAFQFGIFLRCMETSSLVLLTLFCCVTHSNSFSTVIMHSAFLSWSIGLSHNSFQNLIDSSESGITCSCLIFQSNSSDKAFWLFLKVPFCRYCFTLNL